MHARSALSLFFAGAAGTFTSNAAGLHAAAGRGCRALPGFRRRKRKRPGPPRGRVTGRARRGAREGTHLRWADPNGSDVHVGAIGAAGAIRAALARGFRRWSHFECLRRAKQPGRAHLARQRAQRRGVGGRGPARAQGSDAETPHPAFGRGNAAPCLWTRKCLRAGGARGVRACRPAARRAARRAPAGGPGRGRGPRALSRERESHVTSQCGNVTTREGSTRPRSTGLAVMAPREGHLAADLAQDRRLQDSKGSKGLQLAQHRNQPHLVAPARPALRRARSVPPRRARARACACVRVRARAPTGGGARAGHVPPREPRWRTGPPQRCRASPPHTARGASTAARGPASGLRGGVRPGPPLGSEPLYGGIKKGFRAAGAALRGFRV